MKNFIEISPGVSVLKKNIVAIKRKTDDTSTVYVGNNIFKSDIRYEMLISLLDIANVNTNNQYVSV